MTREKITALIKALDDVLESGADDLADRDLLYAMNAGLALISVTTAVARRRNLVPEIHAAPRGK